MAKVALVLGSASCVAADIGAALPLGRYAGVVACNEMIAQWPGELNAAVTFHPEFLDDWLRRRAANGYSAPLSIITADQSDFGLDMAALSRKNKMVMSYGYFPFQLTSGSSGLFAVKAALVDIGFDRAVCCGMPMSKTGHIHRPELPWQHADYFRDGWRQSFLFIAGRVRSMSGWTAELLGRPSNAWLA